MHPNSCLIYASYNLQRGYKVSLVHSQPLKVRKAGRILQIFSPNFDAAMCNPSFRSLLRLIGLSSTFLELQKVH